MWYTTWVRGSQIFKKICVASGPPIVPFYRSRLREGSCATVPWVSKQWQKIIKSRALSQISCFISSWFSSIIKSTKMDCAWQWDCSVKMEDHMTAQKSTDQTSRAGVKCEKCGKMFGNAWGLRVHVSRMHSSKPSVAKRSKNGTNGSSGTLLPHYCPNCGCNMRVVALALKFNAHPE